MSAIYFAIPTHAGQAKIANAIALGVPLKITHMAVGDGNGQPVTPNPEQTALVREQRRAPLNTLFQDPLNPGQLVAEQIIPENVGGWWIREVGLYDETSTLIAIANSPDTYKPQLSEGSGRTQTIRMVLIVSDTSAVELKIDPSVVLATRKYVDDVMAAHKQSRDHPDASETAKGFTSYATKAQTDAGVADDVAVTPKKLRFGFYFLLSENGAIVFPSWLGGFIIQWGESDAGSQSGARNVTLPIAFPNKCFQAFASFNDTAAAVPFAIAIKPISNTTLSMKASSGGSVFARWIAIGN